MATESSMAGTTLPPRQSQSQPPHNEAAASAASQHDDNGNDNDAEHRDGAASPPLPQRHTAVTPGIRAAYLQQLYAQTLRHTLGKLDWKNVAGCYPTISENAEGVLRQVQGQMVDKLQEKCEVRFYLCLLRAKAAVCFEMNDDGLFLSRAKNGPRALCCPTDKMWLTKEFRKSLRTSWSRDR
jgi:hypothetical protein